MVNYWYSAKGNELFLDLDRPYRVNRAMNVLHSWLNDRKEFPEIRYVEHYRTKTEGHEHFVIVFEEEVDFLEKLSIRLLMLDDPIRVGFIVGRIARYCDADDLLMSRVLYHRSPDAVCECTEKHRAYDVTWNCPALKKLLGPYRSMDPFPRTGKPLREPIDLAFGRLNLEQIKHWSAYEKRERTNGEIERATLRHGNHEPGIPGMESAHENSIRVHFAGCVAVDGSDCDCTAASKHQ